VDSIIVRSAQKWPTRAGTLRLFGSSDERDANKRVFMTTPTAVPNDPETLRERAAHYRELAMKVTDPKALKALRELASHYDALAAELEARGQTALCCGQRE
jgi:hypothetical protein